MYGMGGRYWSCQEGCYLNKVGGWVEKRVGEIYICKVT